MTTNELKTAAIGQWEVGATQNSFKMAFPLFGLAEGQVFKEYDLIYIFNDLLFWGAGILTGAVLIPKKTVLPIYRYL